MQTVSHYIGLILLWLYQTVGDLGIAVILFSIALRTILLPLSVSSHRQMEKMKKLQPEINRIKKKHAKDPQAQQLAQAQLLKDAKVNPLSGCLPQLLQLVVLIVLYRVFISFFSSGQLNGTAVDTSFLWMSLQHPDPKYVLPILAGVSQLVLSLMMATSPKDKPVETAVVAESTGKTAKKKKSKKTDVAPEAPPEKDTMTDMAASMQKQMILMMPLLTVFIAWRLPSGLALYWTVTSLYTIAQQYVLSGLGGMKTPVETVKALLKGPQTAEVSSTTKK